VVHWRHEWTKARSRERLSKATLEQHRKAAIAFCHAETATKNTGPVVITEHDILLAESSRQYNKKQKGGGCLLWAEDTVKTGRGVTYRLNVGDDLLPSKGMNTRERKTERDTDKKSKRSSERKSQSKSRNGTGRTDGSHGTCVSS
jgi:hypothetical protein